MPELIVAFWASDQTKQNEKYYERNHQASHNHPGA